MFIKTYGGDLINTNYILRIFIDDGVSVSAVCEVEGDKGCPVAENIYEYEKLVEFKTDKPEEDLKNAQKYLDDLLDRLNKN